MSLINMKLFLIVFCIYINLRVNNIKINRLFAMIVARTLLEHLQYFCVSNIYNMIKRKYNSILCIILYERVSIYNIQYMKICVKETHLKEE